MADENEPEGMKIYMAAATLKVQRNHESSLYLVAYEMELVKNPPALCKFFPFPIYRQHITHPGKHYETIWTTLIPVEDISRPTSLIPTTPSLIKDPALVDRYKKNSTFFWSFTYSYMDRSTWNSMTESQFASYTWSQTKLHEHLQDVENTSSSSSNDEDVINDENFLSIGTGYSYNTDDKEEDDSSVEDDQEEDEEDTNNSASDESNNVQCTYNPHQ